jgi:hypothetical protein
MIMTNSPDHYFGPWVPWDATTASAPPSNINPGDIVQADVVPLAHRLDRMKGRFAPDPIPSILPAYEFIVNNAESFVLDDALAGNALCIVMGRYRVCGQRTPQHGLQELLDQPDPNLEHIDEEELVEHLHADEQRQFEIDNGWTNE